MKKRYINPRMEMVKIGVQAIICMSKVGTINEPLAPSLDKPEDFDF